jgi:hypothetical protein
MKNIISFCLWGDNNLYFGGALKNIELAKKYYPDFVCRFYVSNDFAVDKVNILKKYSEVIVVNQNGSPHMMTFRFLPLEENINIFLSRDTDSRIGPREAYAVKEWLDSGKAFHIIRDHPCHDVPMLGGMWGAKNIKINVSNAIRHYENSELFNDIKNVDQQFLWSYIYPLINETNTFIHDTCTVLGGNPIQMKREDDPTVHFIGEPFGIDENGNDYQLNPYHRQQIKNNSCK